MGDCQPAIHETRVLDHTNQALIERLRAHAGPPIYSLTPDEARNELVRMQSGFRPDTLVTDSKVNSGSRPLRLRTIRPRSASNDAPCIMYFHGGGWVVGDFTTHERLMTELAAGANALLVYVDYDRAPECRYPVAVEQAYAATCYFAENAQEFGVDAARLAVAGDSSGANLATVTTLLAKARSGPKIAGQLLFYPPTSAELESCSHREFADGPWLTRATMQWFWDQYLPDRSERNESSASPLLASLQQLTGLPRALIITAEFDVLRDEGEAYGRKLMQAGVDVVSTRYNGTIHDFMMMNALADAAPTRAAVAQAVDFLKTLGSEKETKLVTSPGENSGRADRDVA
jgi:acetyl esterase